MSQHTKSQMVVSLVPYASPNSPNNPALTRAHSGSTGSLPATESTSPAQTDCLPSPETSRRLITKIGRQPANPGNGIRRSMFVEDLITFADRFLIALWIPTVITDLDNPMTLRFYLENVLRRSCATYHTLLAAFHYLVLLRTMTKRHYTGKQLKASKKLRVLQCPRRMFLSALMLGWKFTQERGSSTRKWARLSGLSSREINSNEAAFLSTIDWRLYIPHTVFARWDTEVAYYVGKPGLRLSDFLLGVSRKT